MLKLATTFYFLTGVSLVILVFFLESRFTSSPTHEPLQKHLAKRTLYILYWTKQFSDPYYTFGSLGYEPFRDCQYKNCYVTYNRSLLPITEYDAVVFHGPQYWFGFEKPPKRSQKQRYVFVTMESMAYHHTDLKPFKGFYNWTMTHRLDSDIRMTYGEIIKNRTDYEIPTIKEIQNKTGVAAWIVSRCQTNNKREVLYEKLLKFFPISVFGKCPWKGTSKCPGEAKSSKTPQCNDYVEQRHKFYFAFENSHCKDYVTEKFFMALQRNIVPVVYGMADYNRIAPPYSFINVADYKSVQDLTKYLLYLDKNPLGYLKYFEWKKNYSVVRANPPAQCQMCEKLNKDHHQKVYDDLNQWWWDKNDRNCKSGQFFNT